MGIGEKIIYRATALKVLTVSAGAGAPPRILLLFGQLKRIQ